jgi:hypothetical protein
VILPLFSSLLMHKNDILSSVTFFISSRTLLIALASVPIFNSNITAFLPLEIASIACCFTNLILSST